MDPRAKVTAQGEKAGCKHSKDPAGSKPCPAAAMPNCSQPSGMGRELNKVAREATTWTCFAPGLGFHICLHAEAAKSREHLLNDLFQDSSVVALVHL